MGGMGGLPTQAEIAAVKESQSSKPATGPQNGALSPQMLKIGATGANSSPRAAAPLPIAPIQAGGGARARYYRRQKRAAIALRGFQSAASITPEEYRKLSRRTKIGGQLRRDVTAFGDLVKKVVDVSNGSRIPFDAFMAEIEKGQGGLQFMRRQLELIFRTVDKDGVGSLPIDSFAKVIFPKASSEEIKEMVCFILYDGPDPDQMKIDWLKRAAPDQLDLLRALFDEYDADGGGTVSRSEMQAAFRAMTSGGANGDPSKYDPSQQSAMSVADEVAEIFGSDGDDEDDDREITFDEFIQLLGPFFIADPDDDDD
jgi:Ca2+-binding EF-hand superfamily protein